MVASPQRGSRRRKKAATTSASSLPLTLTEPLLGLSVEEKGRGDQLATAEEGSRSGEPKKDEGGENKSKKLSQLFRVSSLADVKAKTFPSDTAPPSLQSNRGTITAAAETRDAVDNGSNSGGEKGRRVEWADEEEDDSEEEDEMRDYLASDVGSSSFPDLLPAGGEAGGGAGGAATDRTGVTEEGPGRGEDPVVDPGGDSEARSAAAPPTTTITTTPSTTTLQHPLQSPLDVPPSTSMFDGGGAVSPSGDASPSNSVPPPGCISPSEGYSSSGGVSPSGRVAMAAAGRGSSYREREDGPREARGGGIGRGPARGLSRGVSARFSTAVTADMKLSEVFSKPLASEGDGSVFPVNLPTSRRRALEVNFIRKFDRLVINPNIGEFWMLIDSEWVARWCSFILGQTGPPGPISNRRFFEDVEFTQTPAQSPAATGSYPTFRSPTRSDGGMSTGIRGVSLATVSESGDIAYADRNVIRPHLKPIKDYRAIHPVVWYIFREMYDTDETPAICRWKLDLYSGEVSVHRRDRILEPARTKALYQLRRFSAQVKQDMRDEENEAARLEQANAQRAGRPTGQRGNYPPFTARRTQQSRVGAQPDIAVAEF